MILKGSIRGNGSQLSRHLLNDRDNDHVELHEVRGFVGDDLDAAFLEAEAIAKGTRCQKFLFSLSLNPPESEDVSIDAFEAAIEMAEQQLGLNDQPRTVVFHEKDGRRQDIDQMIGLRPRTLACSLQAEPKRKIHSNWTADTIQASTTYLSTEAHRRARKLGNWHGLQVSFDGVAHIF
jgi:hypothetical protein